MTQQNEQFDLAAEIEAAARTGDDMRVGKSGGGGGDYVPPAKGLARARLVGYYEIGVHEVDELNDAGQKTGKKKDENQVKLVFELSGPKHEPKKLDDGTLIPHRLSVTMKKSNHVKAGFYKLFTMMNHDGAATHMVQLLGKPFLATVYHKKNAAGKVFAGLKGNDKTEPVGNGFSITGPKVQDAETGEDKLIEVAEAITPLGLYLFDTTKKAMWDALYIPGEYPERKDEKTGEILSPARSKNVLQNLIRSAKNFDQSPMHGILTNNGADLDIPGAVVPEAPPANGASSDPYGEMDDDVPF
jgi:hypothetical protein